MSEPATPETPRNPLPACLSHLAQRDRPHVEAAPQPPDPIRIWRFYDAPQELQDLSTNGGDEDWLAVLPAGFEEAHGIPLWLELGHFGCCCVDRHEGRDGELVLIGSHA